MTLQELKAAAYDTMVQIENMQIKLRQINNAIADWKEPPTTPPVETK